MKATPPLAFIVAAVCTAALAPYALAGGGHGHHHGHGMNPRMMPDNPMMGMGMGTGRGGMTAAERAFFTNDSKAPVGNRAASPAGAQVLTAAKQGITNSGATKIESNTFQQAVFNQNATKHHRQPQPIASATPGNPPARPPIPIPIKTVPASPIGTPAGEPAALNAPAAAQMFKGASSAGSPSGG